MELHDSLSAHFRLSSLHARGLKTLRIETIADLLYHFPTRYENIESVRRISELALNESAVVFARLTNLKARKSWKSRRPIAEADADDGSGKIHVIWFNQPYLSKMIPEGSAVKLSGRVSGKENKIYLANPEVERLDALPTDITSLFGKTEDAEHQARFPVYPETAGVTSRWFYHALERVFKSGLHTKLVDPLQETLRRRYHLPSLTSALLWIHKPRSEDESVSARKRFAFEEVFYIQIAKQEARREHNTHPTVRIELQEEALRAFLKRFPFIPTRAQRTAIEEILTDFKRPHAMSRLLEGDVGSGKTAVAATTAYATVMTQPKGQSYGRLQSAYMVPTEILAKQHFDSFITYFEHLPINIGLMTGSGCKKFPSKVDPSGATNISRAQLLKWVANGEIPILIGTHALIEKTVKFKNLAYVIIDEQHRFGTLQRGALVRKDKLIPHLLSMTATPIPRTLALTLYGDLDLSVLNEMPEGRKPVITEVVYPKERARAYEKIREELSVGRQAYVVCPRIDEPDPQKMLTLATKSVKEEARRLKKEVFPEFEIEVLHGKLSAKEKDAVMERFLSGATHILVATSVIEVGVNVPNATVIVIEGAERFGLAQLHQLRGRVIRSTHQAYCFVFAETRGKTTQERLKALKTAKNGFELAEHDLKIRGAGELYGRTQSGLSDIGMEALRNLKMVEAAREEAKKLVETDPELVNHPLIKERVRDKAKRLHFE
jgi:ATP-dependent DNA helicase RecG